MEGSQHPELTETSVVAREVLGPLTGDESKDVASSNAGDGNARGKRQHEDADAEHDAKRQHLAADADSEDEEEEAEDLDLNVLMAQLQQHAERASAGTDDSGDKPRSAEDANHEAEGGSMSQSQDAELSIEQQLKGALSSLQDLEGEFEDDDDDDDDNETNKALDQISRILGRTEPSGKPEDAASTKDAASETASQDIAAKDTGAKDTASAVEQVTREDADQTETVASSLADNTSRSGQASQPESADQATAIASADAEAVVSESGKPAEAKDKPAGSETDSSSKARESLLAKMPPPPAHAGALPPMPPPPAALTSPTAPYIALELARNSQSTASAQVSSADQRDKMLNSRLHHIYSPTFSEPPALSKDYKASLADQVDTLAEAAKDEAKEEAYTTLLLNDNQTVLQARQRSMILLDSLAGQVLDVLSFSHYQETLATVMQPDSERGMAYRMLLDAFEDVKRLYSKWRTKSSRDKAEPKPDEVRPFLSYDMPGVEPSRENLVTLQRANLATFVAAIFGTIEIGFWELDKWFLKVFVPENGRLLKQQANIYLDLKTQAYISAVESFEDENLRKEALEHLFPEDLETKMQDLLGERMSLAPSEQDFVAKCHRRRENIKAESEKDLPIKYHWVPFLREVSDYISRNHYTLLPQRRISSLHTGEVSSTPSPAPSSRPYVSQRRTVPSSAVAISSRSTDAPNSLQRGKESSPKPGSRTTEARTDNKDHDTDVQVASIQTTAAAGRPQDPKVEIEDAPHNKTDDGQQNAGSDKKDSTTPQGSDAGTAKRHPDIPAEGHPLFPPLPKQVLPPPSLSSSHSSNNTTEHLQQRHTSLERSRRPGPRPHSQAPVAANSPTDTLAVYEAAKASAEGTDAVRPKTSLFTTRRTWTKEEEEALLKGMDRVQGPYWAQILELYGPGGKISEVLKDRSQVQLKDKARNLKMFFLRLGLPIPAVFQYVTGDYETRRSSGKKVRERKQQRAAPSNLSQQTNAPSLAQPTVPGQQLTGQAPQQPSSSGIDNTAAASKSLDIPASESNADQHKSAVSSAETTGATAPKETLNNSENAGPVEAAKSVNVESAAAPKEPVPSDSSVATKSSNKAETKNADSNNATDGSERPASDQRPSPNKNATAGPNEKDSEANIDDEIDETSEKEEDISSLLNRVGEYVENH